jgi:hypothetical protein
MCPDHKTIADFRDPHPNEDPLVFGFDCGALGQLAA